MSGRRDLGDFQTPPELARAVLATLGPIGSRWTRLFEPTCGTGAFFRALLDSHDAPPELIGVELDAGRCATGPRLAAETPGVRIQVLHASLFDLDLRRDLPWRETGPLLVVGNPPWVTAAALGRLASHNRPGRRNVHSLPGIAARTGAANFDLGEAVWIKLIEDLADQEPTIALLCKTAVARSVLAYTQRRGLKIAAASLREINATRWFGTSVQACLLSVSLGQVNASAEVPVYSDLSEAVPRRVMEFRHGRMVADARALEPVAFALGTSPLAWRQGLKHDAAAVMELNAAGPEDPWRNRLGETVEVEEEYVFPLLKGADLRKPEIERPRRGVIVPQRRLGESTTDLAAGPRLWSYLQRHALRLAARKSSIYRGQPPFALFGIGPYSFTLWKVAVSGLYRPARFQAVGPRQGRPVLLDDTCYLLPCESAPEAALLAALGNHSVSQALIEALSFAGSKRPVTKSLLQRIDLPAILGRVDRPELAAAAAALLGELPDSPIDPIAAVLEEMKRLAERFPRAVLVPSPP